MSGSVIRLDDGHEIRLTGIEAKGDAAKEKLQRLIAGKELKQDNGVIDRYGRVAADIYASTDNGETVWLQGALLKDGFAFVYPPTGSEPRLADLLKAEHDARTAGIGIWGEAEYADKPADRPRAIPYGRFVFIAGKVVKAERVKNKFYLNFGDNWRSDFTATIAAHDLRLFTKAGIDPETYQGKTVRVRGWVKRDFGPMITVTHPAQIELLGETATRP